MVVRECQSQAYMHPKENVSNLNTCRCKCNPQCALMGLAYVCRPPPCHGQLQIWKKVPPAWGGPLPSICWLPHGSQNGAKNQSVHVWKLRHVTSGTVSMLRAGSDRQRTQWTRNNRKQVNNHIHPSHPNRKQAKIQPNKNIHQPPTSRQNNQDNRHQKQTADATHTVHIKPSKNINQGERTTKESPSRDQPRVMGMNGRDMGWWH